MKKIVSFALSALLAVGCMAMPVLAEEEHIHEAYESAEEAPATMDPTCPTCGRVGRWMYDIPQESGAWGLTIAVYYCDYCEAPYQFYWHAR